MRDHLPIVQSQFRGTFDRGEDDTVPYGYFISSQNIRFKRGGVATRYGTTQVHTVANVRRVAVYKRIGEAQRLLILNSAGQLYDSTLGFSAPILSIAAMTDFSMVTIFNRAYITPHNGLSGLPGEKVYVYNGSGTAVPAAGTPPSGFTLGTADSAASGSVEAGVHALGVCFETSTGFITKPGGFKAHTSAGAKKIDLSLLPIGGAQVVARHIVSTRLLTNFNGDFNNQTYFFVPNGRIGNNIATTFTVDFFDADLQDEASYLLEQLAEIPAGVGITLYRGKMCVWGENVNPAVVRVSKTGEPESVNEVEGFITVNPGDSGGGVNNCTEYRGSLVMCKSQRTYVTTDDGLNEAAFWSVSSVDMSVGTSCHGFGKSLDFGENVQDHLFIAGLEGLRLFGGTYNDNSIITHNFEDQWARINPAAFHTLEMGIDPINQHIYVAVPLDSATTPSHLFFADYSEGLDKDNIRWTTWVFPWAPQSVVIDVVNSIVQPRFGGFAGNIYNLDPAVILDGVTAINHWIEFPLYPTGSDNDVDEVVNHFVGCRMRIKGVGNLDIFVRGYDSGQTALQSISLALAPAKPYFRGFNFINERCSVKLSMDGPSEKMDITKFILYYVELWQDRPNIA